MIFNPFRKAKNIANVSQSFNDSKPYKQLRMIPLSLVFTYPYLPVKIISAPNAWEKENWPQDVTSDFLAEALGRPDGIGIEKATHIKKLILNILLESKIYNYRLGGYKITEFDIPHSKQNVTDKLYYITPDEYYDTPKTDCEICIGEMVTQSEEKKVVNAWIKKGSLISDVNIGCLPSGSALRDALKVIPEIIDKTIKGIPTGYPTIKTSIKDIPGELNNIFL